MITERYKHIHSLENSGPENISIRFCEDGSIIVNNPNCDEPDNKYRFVDGGWVQEKMQ